MIQTTVLNDIRTPSTINTVLNNQDKFHDPVLINNQDTTPAEPCTHIFDAVSSLL